MKRVSGRQRKNCPVCSEEGLLKLSNHLKEIHGIDGTQREELLGTADKFSEIMSLMFSSIIFSMENINIVNYFCCFLSINFTMFNFSSEGTKNGLMLMQNTKMPMEHNSNQPGNFYLST